MKRCFICLALAAAALWAVPPPVASAVPGSGDVVTVVEPFVMDTPGGAFGLHELTHTVMCPSGTRALGGGAAPVGASTSGFGVSLSAPVTSSGGPASATEGATPAGWTVTVVQSFLVADTHNWKAFVNCSASSDAEIRVGTAHANLGSLELSVACPVGARTLGGGLAAADPGNLPAIDQALDLLSEDGPVSASGTVAGSAAGSVPVAWRVYLDKVTALPVVPVAVCSTSADAVLAATDFAVPAASQRLFEGATATCPARRRATSGGIALTGPHVTNDRVVFQAPVETQGGLSGVSTGAVPHSWYGEGIGDSAVDRVYRVLAVCVSEPDTTPPDTAKSKGPRKKTTSTKAKFVFSSEAGATFTCRLDKKAAKPCTSPYKVKKVKPGKHKLTVTATDAAGNADPSPAVFKWKVLKKKPKVHPPHGCTGECRLAAGGYTTYVACSTKASAQPATQCRLSQTKAAFFRSSKHDAPYKVCVKFPGKKKRLCASAQDAVKGQTKFVTLATSVTGRHRITWYVAGKKVGSWKLDVVEGSPR